MNRHLYYVILFFLVLSCSDNPQLNDSIKIELYESYDIVELFPKILESNLIIRKKQIDSLANQKTGLALVDRINEQTAKSDSYSGNSIEDFPLFHVLQPNIKIGQDGLGYVDTTAIIGTTQDTIGLIKYLLLADSLFPADLKWKFSGYSKDNFMNVHATVRNGDEVQLTNTDLDSIIVTPIGLNSFGGVIEKISDLKGFSSYIISIKLKNGLKSKLSRLVYSIIFKINNHEYSGSVVNFKNNPEQYIMIGEIDNNDFTALKNRFETKIKIKK